MTKKLLTQIKNEWRSNLWLGVELLLVSVVLWYVVDYLCIRTAIYLEPRGFDISHTYLIGVDELTETSPDYHPYTDQAKEQGDEMLELLDRIQHRPEVEAASLSQNSYPYNGSNSSSPVGLAGDTLTSSDGTILRRATPDFVRVFRYEGANGETPEQLAEKLEHDELLVSDNLFEHYGHRASEYISRQLYANGDTVQTITLGATYKPVRYSDFHSLYGSASKSVLMKIPSNNVNWARELCVRVKADQDVNFIENLKRDADSQLRVGNMYITSVRSFKDQRTAFQSGWITGMRSHYVGMGFLMLNVFLGLLGTFWFRTQQRRGEIALHKIHGATNGAVFSRLVCEGLWLLLLVTPLAVIIDYNLAHLELNEYYYGAYDQLPRLLLCAGIAFALIAVMILIGIGIPAHQAMKIQPAQALHDE